MRRTLMALASAISLLAATFGAAPVGAAPVGATATEEGGGQMYRQLADKQELQELVLRYARLVDRKHFARLADLYHPDGSHDHGGMFAGPVPDFIAWLEQSMTQTPMETQHLVANSLFFVDGDTARGEIYTINFHHFPEAGMNYVAGGRYLDHYVRRDGRWVFWSRARVIDWSEERKADSGKTASSVVRGQSWRTDASRSLAPFFDD